MIREQEGYTVFGRFKIPPAKQRSNPPPFPDFSDKYKGSNLLELSLQHDIAWVLISSIGKEMYEMINPHSDETLSPVGSWTAFMKDTSSVGTEKCKLEYATGR